MALTAWKAFDFFETAPVKLPEESASYYQTKLSCATSGSGNVFLGDNEGTVRILSPSLKIIRSFSAYEHGVITHMKQVDGTSLLMTIAEDLSNEPILKVWALDKLEKKTDVPRCLSTVNVSNERKQFPISAFAALEDLSQLAVGFGNGAVTVIRGDLIHDRGTKQRIVFKSDEPITGLAFRGGGTTMLYIATTARISVLVLSGKGQGQPARTLEDRGCAVDCITVDKTTRDVVVARDDAIYYFGPQGRGPSFAYQGSKSRVTTFKQYVVLSSPPGSDKSIWASSQTAGQRLGSGSNSSVMTFLDTDLKFVASQEIIEGGCRFLVEAWGDMYVITTDGSCFRLREKPLSRKLEILYQRNLFVLAINLAQKYNLDRRQQNMIYRKYGDYLYQKGDFDTAMQQYLRAIDNTEPSQIIRKFLDTHQIRNLTDYLEELHEHHKATPDHTTLLLNCYAKLKDVSKLEDFIKAPGDAKFDRETAISMCRQGGYFEQAVFLARKFEDHIVVVEILVEETKQFAEAMAYICRLSPSLAWEAFMRYSNTLIERCSSEALPFLIEFCTGKYRPKRDAVIVQNTAAPKNPVRSSSAVQNLAAFVSLPYMSNSGVVSPAAKDSSGTQSSIQLIETSVASEPLEYDVPSPRAAFPALLDHPDAFITFLEACVSSEAVKSQEIPGLYTTVFELYLKKAKITRHDSDERSRWEGKAKELIQQKKVPLQDSNVLLLSYLEDFSEGTRLVRETQGLQLDIFRSYTAAGDIQGAIRALHTYGPEEPQLYPAALAYFISSPKVIDEAGAEVAKTLRKINQDNLMAPLQVIQLLSTNSVATMGLIKDYVSGYVDKERQDISSNRRLISTYRKETTSLRESAEDLATRPQTFQASRCSACGAPLDLPTVHYLCKHSFHQRCLNAPSTTAPGVGGVNSLGANDATIETSAECPICAAQNATIKAIRQAQIDSAKRHDMFHDALAQSKDGFATIGEWFGRGVMSVD